MLDYWCKVNDVFLRVSHPDFHKIDKKTSATVATNFY